MNTTQAEVWIRRSNIKRASLVRADALMPHDTFFVELIGNDKVAADDSIGRGPTLEAAYADAVARMAKAPRHCSECGHALREAA